MNIKLFKNIIRGFVIIILLFVTYFSVEFLGRGNEHAVKTGGNQSEESSATAGSTGGEIFTGDEISVASDEEGSAAKQRMFVERIQRLGGYYNGYKYPAMMESLNLSSDDSTTLVTLLVERSIVNESVLGSDINKDKNIKVKIYPSYANGYVTYNMWKDGEKKRTDMLEAATAANENHIKELLGSKYDQFHVFEQEIPIFFGVNDRLTQFLREDQYLSEDQGQQLLDIIYSQFPRPEMTNFYLLNQTVMDEARTILNDVQYSALETLRAREEEDSVLVNKAFKAIKK